MTYEEEMRVKNEMSEVREMYVSGRGEVKRKGGGYKGWWGEKKERKKKKEMRRCGMRVVGKKEMERGVYGGKKWEGKRKKKKFDWEKIKLVLFVCTLCLMQIVEL